MLGSLLVGLAATLGTIVIHGFVFHTIVMNLHNNLQRGVLGARLWVNLAFIMGAVLRALVGHLGEIALWAFALVMSGAVTDINAAIFSSPATPPLGSVAALWRACALKRPRPTGSTDGAAATPDMITPSGMTGRRRKTSVVKRALL
jgi:hypothetical protein